MGNRNLINGKQSEELDQRVQLMVETKSPTKWILIDGETGQIYRGCDEIRPRGLNVRRCHEWKLQNIYFDVPQDVLDIITEAAKENNVKKKVEGRDTAYPFKDPSSVTS